MEPCPSIGGECPEPDPLHILHFDDYDEVQPYWTELNRSYKDGDLSVDWGAHALIWKCFYAPRGHQLDIAVALEGDRCVGIFPLTRSDVDPYGSTRWSLSDDFVIAREYFCLPEALHRCMPLLPPHFSDDMSCFLAPADLHGFASFPGGVVDLRTSEAEYFESLRTSARKHLRANLRRNEDIRHEVDDRIRWPEIRGILDIHLQYWQERCGGPDTAYYAYSRDKIHCDLALLGRAEEMGRLVALYFFLDETLVAANFSVRREQDRVDDYLCLRDSTEAHAARGLGILAILRNMEHCRSLGIRYYDLGAGTNPYKQQFKNITSCYYAYTYDEPAAASVVTAVMEV